MVGRAWTQEEELYAEYNDNGTIIDPDGHGKIKGDPEHNADCIVARKALEDLIEWEMNAALEAHNFDTITTHFVRCLQCAGMALLAKWTEAQEDVNAAIARAHDSLSADNFIALQCARMHRKVVATEIVMNEAGEHGETDEYNRAKTAHDEFTKYEDQLGQVQARFAGLSESDKTDFLATNFPTLWAQYQKGELPTPDSDFGAGAHSASGINQPFLQTLSDLFTSAVKYLTGNPDLAAPATQQGQGSLPQPVTI